MAVKAVKRSQTKIKEAEIEAKDQRWHCRNRVTLVFGSNHPEELETYLYTEDSIQFQMVNFHQAKSKAIEELLDNCVDEFYRGHVTQVSVNLSEDEKTVTVTDNGIGFPLNKIPLVYTEFRTGSKFKDEEVDSKGYLARTLGQNGVGASATCLTADLFEATVKHYNSKKEQTYTFIDGALEVKKSRPKPYKGASGVSVTVQLSDEVYGDAKIDKQLLRKRIIDLAYNNPGLEFKFNGEQHLYDKGLLNLAQRIDEKSAQLLGETSYTVEGKTKAGKKYKAKIDIHVSLTIDPKSEERERFIDFVNSTPTFDGGFHRDRIRRIYINQIKEKLIRETKKEKIDLNDNDILTGLTFVSGIIMPNPRFESQTKRKLVRHKDLEKCIESFMDQHMKKFLRNNKDYLEQVLERARSRHRFQELKDASIKAKKAKKVRVEKLLDANERKDRSNCTLFICEGDSAIGGLRSSRDKLTQGGIALRGKPMNVSQARIKDVIENQEFAGIMASIGLTIGQPVDEEQLRYSKVVFLADSDVDGGHINTLLTNFFYTFWPEMFEKGMVQIAKAPLFEVITDKGTYYAETPSELEEIKKKPLRVKEIQRNKGLGEMSAEAFKYVMNRGDYTRISIEDIKDAQHIMETCFGKDSQLRKNLLMDDAPESVEYTDGRSRPKASQALKKKTAKKITKKTTKKKVSKKKTTRR